MKKQLLVTELTDKPKVEYIVGEALEKEGGRFTVVFEDETTETHALTDEGVEITGFDASKEAVKPSLSITKELAQALMSSSIQNQLSTMNTSSKIG